jgi:hypothetical protein
MEALISSSDASGPIRQIRTTATGGWLSTTIWTLKWHGSIQNSWAVGGGIWAELQFTLCFGLQKSQSNV